MNIRTTSSLFGTDAPLREGFIDRVVNGGVRLATSLCLTVTFRPLDRGIEDNLSTIAPGLNASQVQGAIKRRSHHAPLN
jgi:hypothetical protein